MYTLKLSPTHFVSSKSSSTAASSATTSLDPATLLSTLAALQKDERDLPLSSLALNHHPMLGFSSQARQEPSAAGSTKLSSKSSAKSYADEDDSLDSSSVSLPHCLPFRPAFSSAPSSSSSKPPSEDAASSEESAEKKKRRRKKNKRNSKENGETSPSHNGQQQQHENGVSDADSDAAAKTESDASSTSAPKAHHPNGSTKSPKKSTKKKSSPNASSSTTCSAPSEPDCLLSFTSSSLRSLYRSSLQSAVDEVFAAIEEQQQKLKSSHGNNALVLTAKLKRELTKKVTGENSENIKKFVQNAKQRQNTANTSTTTVIPTSTHTAVTIESVEKKEEESRA